MTVNFFIQAQDCIRDKLVTGVQTCALPIFVLPEDAASAWLRSMISNNMVNELRLGYGGAPVIFWQNDLTRDMFSGPVANQGGFYLNVNNPTFITQASNSATPSARDAFNQAVENTLSWQKGSHSLSIGGAFSN